MDDTVEIGSWDRMLLTNAISNREIDIIQQFHTISFMTFLLILDGPYCQKMIVSIVWNSFDSIKKIAIIPLKHISTFGFVLV